MIRMVKEEDTFALWWWYNWYITHSVATFETQPVSEKEFRERIRTVREQYPWIVMEIDDELVGYAYLSHFNPRDAYDTTCDLAIYLNPEKRGMGYGKQLMKAIIDLAKEDGYYKMVSIITEGNTASEKLHEACGFVKEGEYRNFGYKNNRWLGVSYYVNTLKDVQGDEKPQKPKNLNPFDTPKKNRVPIL